VRRLTAGEKPGRGTARRWAATIALAGVGAAAVAGLAGCSSATSAGAAGTAGTSCGHTRTGVGVPVVVKVAKGSVNCATALRVERDYAAAIRSGELRGNGGGAPMTVDGWTCEAYPTAQVLRTGDASECHTASAEVVALLSLPSAPAGS
jgi:hypothetical protein